jgi:hypothetical protein
MSKYFLTVPDQWSPWISHLMLLFASSSAWWGDRNWEAAHYFHLLFNFVFC